MSARRLACVALLAGVTGAWMSIDSYAASQWVNSLPSGTGKDAAIAALEGSPLSPVWLVILLSAAAVLGDAVNYKVGRRIGPSIFRSST